MELKEGITAGALLTAARQLTGLPGMEIPPNAVTDLFPLAGKDQYDQINKKRATAVLMCSLWKLIDKKITKKATDV